MGAFFLAVFSGVLSLLAAQAAMGEIRIILGLAFGAGPQLLCFGHGDYLW
jgi:hypothetical protein